MKKQMKECGRISNKNREDCSSRTSFTWVASGLGNGATQRLTARDFGLGTWDRPSRPSEVTGQKVCLVDKGCALRLRKKRQSTGRSAAAEVAGKD